MRKEVFRQVPFHTFFLAAYPIIGLMAVNVDQIHLQGALKPLFFSLTITAVTLGGLRLITKSWQLAGLLTSLLVAWFFLYGRIYLPLKGLSLFGLIVGRHRYLLILWTGIIVAAAFWMVRRSRINPDLTMALNVFSTILILLPTIQVGAFLLRDFGPPRTSVSSSVTHSISWTDDSTPPDIYYIVLDGYARSDVLEDIYEIDITPFLDELVEMGFYIAECAQSNYSRTSHALVSTFNMEFVQTLTPEAPPDANQSILFPFLKHNTVRQQLEGLGYQTIAFKHPWEHLVWDDATILYESSGTAILSPFEYLLLRTTTVRVYLDLLEAETNQLADYAHYEDTLYALRQLESVPDIPGQKFVFAHLIIPHPPFVFGPDGEWIDIPYDADAGNIYTWEDDKRGTIAAVTYINKRMLEIIPQLIRGSKTPPIIVIAGDHGTPWGGRENEVKILAGFYTPGADSPFYENITSVNIFRILFDTYFNGSYGTLPDNSYLFTELGRFDFREFPSVCEDAN